MPYQPGYSCRREILRAVPDALSTGSIQREWPRWSPAATARPVRSITVQLPDLGSSARMATRKPPETYVTGVGPGPLSVDRDGNLSLAHFIGGLWKIAPDRTVTRLVQAAPFAVTVGDGSVSSPMRIAYSGSARRKALR